MAGKYCRGIINLLFDGITDNIRGHLTASRKISGRIICKTIG